MQDDLQRESQSRLSRERLRPDRSRRDCPVLLSERLVLRGPHEDDIDAIAHLANNNKIATMVSRMPHPYTIDDAANFVRRGQEGVIGNCVYAITKADNGAFLGCCAVETIPDDDSVVEIGYWLGEPYWGKGYTTEAAQILIDMVFRTREEVETVDARCRVVNAASRRVLQKCGFQYQGAGMAQSLAVGGSVPVEWYRLDRRTWMSLKSWGAPR
ncbi:GNAT family N-acetyltransferase [Martelella alba]|uniref:GNAT family N-acetyltransferase n=1 Tax=Martelella alba TaxID=2590451 RepID=A0A506UAL1_9HYPH|nr:GNAT family protein [Martelella alba]TPW31452.1 GNAT family N-acetyltransferase [Martelella alba]